MEKASNSTEKTLNSWYRFRFRVVLESVVVGILVGFVIVFYRTLLEALFKTTQGVYAYLKVHTNLIPLWFLALIIVAILITLIVEWEPVSSGSGIPQTEATLIGYLKPKWLRVVVAKIVGGAMAVFGGLAVGREGPSIQIGACIGQGYGQVLKKTNTETKFLITAGSSAGLAAAFNAPISGVIFALEEVHKSFSTIILTCTLAATIAADFVTNEFFGLKPIFTISVGKLLPLKYYGYLIILGIIIGVFGKAFSICLVKSCELHEKLTFCKGRFKVVPAFLFAGVLGIFMPYSLGGGHNLFQQMVAGSFSLKILIALVVIRFFFTMISYGSGSPGGIFLPLLVIGAITGAVYGQILHLWVGLDSVYVMNFAILAMAGYLTAIVKAPITGMVLITEMTGSFSYLLSLAVVCIVAYEVTELLKEKPIYETLLERMLKAKGHDIESDRYNKVLLEIPVAMCSGLADKKVRDIKWPKECLLVSIKRGGEEIIPKGDTMVFPGDYIIVLTNEQRAPQINEILNIMGSNVCIYK